MDDLKEKEIPNAEESDSEGSGLTQATYPWESIEDSIDLLRKLTDGRIIANPISKKDMSIIVGKSESTLTMKISTAVQYGLLKKVFKKGYLPGDLFDKYMNPVFDDDQKKALLHIMNSPSLYKKLIEELNGKTIPTEAGLANHLKGSYGLNPNSTERAAKVFFENARYLGIVDNTRRMRFIIPDAHGSANPAATNKHVHEQHTGNGAPPPPPPPPPADDLFELPIPLPNKRKAYLRYPLDNLTRKDINVITKALEFIASSLDEE